jgi:hypothetical protein
LYYDQPPKRVPLCGYRLRKACYLDPRHVRRRLTWAEKDGGEAPSNVLCLLSEIIRRNTHIRPTLASGEHGAPVQGLGPVVNREFVLTNYCSEGRGLVALRGLGSIVASPPTFIG